MKRMLIRLPILRWCCLALVLLSSYTVATAEESHFWTDPYSGIQFRWVEGGCFIMGMSEAEEAKLRSRLKPHFMRQFEDEVRREACLEGYWIATKETTQAQWENVSQWNATFCTMHAGPDNPVAFLNWHQASAFARELTDLHQGKERFTLPTEAQFERACRLQNANDLGIARLGDDWAEWVQDFYTTDGVPPVIEERGAPRVLKSSHCSNRDSAVSGYVNCKVSFRLVRLGSPPQ